MECLRAAARVECLRVECLRVECLRVECLRVECLLVTWPVALVTCPLVPV